MADEVGGLSTQARNASMRKHSHRSEELKNETTLQPFWAFLAGELTKKWVSVPTGVRGLNVQEELGFCYRIGAKKMCLEPKRKTSILLSCLVVSVGGKLWQSSNTTSKHTNFMGMKFLVASL